MKLVEHFFQSEITGRRHGQRASCKDVDNNAGNWWLHVGGSLWDFAFAAVERGNSQLVDDFDDKSIRLSRYDAYIQVRRLQMYISRMTEYVLSYTKQTAQNNVKLNSIDGYIYIFFLHSRFTLNACYQNDENAQHWQTLCSMLALTAQQLWSLRSNWVSC